MASFEIDEIDLTPPSLDDKERFEVWVLENMGRIHNTLKDGYTGDVTINTVVYTYKFGVLISFV